LPKREKLSVKGIVEAAEEMIAETGLSGFSMRKLATRLGVDPMAIYHHHKNKGALIHAVLDDTMARCNIPNPSGVWQQDIRDLCEALREVGKKYPGVFEIYETYEDWLSAEHRLHEAYYAVLQTAGFAPQTIIRAVRLLLAYTEAFAVDEIAGWLDQDNKASYLKSLEEGDYPNLIDVRKSAGPVDFDVDFAFGLNVIIRGLEGELS
jgi:AcrR family transcriptional regulator